MQYRSRRDRVICFPLMKAYMVSFVIVPSIMISFTMAIALAAVRLTAQPRQSSSGQSSSGQSSPRQSFKDAFDQMVHDDGVVGAAYVRLENGRITESHAVGMADEAVHQPVDANTIFHWASVTKTFTAVAIMQLRDRGKLSLDDPILKYVPELASVHSDDNGIAKVTIRHLLSHTAGFQGPTWPYTEGKPWQPLEPTQWSQLVAMMPYQQLDFAPGTKYQYSNPAFIYLGRVIEKLSGDPYEVYIQKNILTPLEMTRTYFNITPYHLAKDRSTSYSLHRESGGKTEMKAYAREFDTGITTANGGMNAPLTDMAKWVAFLSGAGRSLSGQSSSGQSSVQSSPRQSSSGSAPAADAVLSRKSLEEMWQPVIVHEGDDAQAPPEFGGTGFFLFPRGEGADAVTLVGHTGHQAGFALFFVLNPRNGRAVIAALNTVHDSGPTPAEQAFSKESSERLHRLMEEAMETVR
jgi:CubicO group peptidase (beta-lactamase class C family)